MKESNSFTIISIGTKSVNKDVTHISKKSEYEISYFLNIWFNYGRKRSSREVSTSP